MKQRGKNKKGFTIVETLVAISIVLVGVSAAFSAAQLGLSSSSSVRDRITAIFLAQEAMEGVKNMKDSNLLKISTSEEDINWLGEITDICDSAAVCGYDTVYGSLFRCESENDCKVFYEGNFYRQSLGGIRDATDTGLVRQIYITETVPDFEAKVRVVISKPSGNFPGFEITNFIYNWF